MIDLSKDKRSKKVLREIVANQSSHLEAVKTLHKEQTKLVASQVELIKSQERLIEALQRGPRR